MSLEVDIDNNKLRREGRRTKSHKPSPDEVAANLDQFLAPDKYAGMIRDVIIFSDEPGIKMIQAFLVADLGCNEHCRHHDCAEKVPARSWDIGRMISQKDKDGSLFGSELEEIIIDGLVRFRITEVVIHAMEAHNSFRG